MNILLCPVGSAGDVHPYMGLGKALQDRGHQVTLICSGYFEELAVRVGLRFVPLGTRDEFIELTDHPDLWHPTRGFAYIFRGVSGYMREQFELIESLSEGASDTLVLSSCLGFGARVARDRLRIPLLTVHLQPAVMWSEFDSPALPKMWSGAGIPRFLKRWQFRLGETCFIDPVVAPVINPWLEEIGLPPLLRTTQWWHSPDGILGLFPSWCAAAQPDWPRPVHLTQFPLWDEQTVTPVSEEMERFLAGGSPPIVFTPGSAMRFGESFFGAAADACRRLGMRGLLLSRFTEHIPDELPDGVRHFAYAPFSQVLPRAAAVVHHGGIGSVAQGMAAGIPQLVMPMSHDQPDNARRLKRFGVGDALVPRQFRGRRVAAALKRLIESPKVAAACATLAERLQGVEPFDEACRIVEQQGAMASP